MARLLHQPGVLPPTSMPSNHVLFIQENKLLASLYREHLESGGFQVETVRSGCEALASLACRIPDAVIIDPLTPGREADDVVREIRMRPATQTLPIFTLPVTRAPLTKVLENAGATRAVPRTVNPPAELTDTVQAALGRDRTATMQRCMPLQPDAKWMRTSAIEAASVINEMRHSVQSAMHESQRRNALRALLQQTHGLTEQFAIFGQRPVFQFAAALESLAFDLNRFSDQTNPSTLRTVGQSIDFLEVLLNQAGQRDLGEISSAQILAVDDEDGARKIIMAAMGTVGIRSIAVDSPDNAQSALRTQTFDLIFLDVGLPQMTGFELCTRIRNHERHESTPVVFITGMATFQNRAQSSLSGGNDFVGKPFNIPELGVKALMWVLRSRLSLM